MVEFFIGPVVDGRTVKAGDLVRLRDGRVHRVLSVTPNVDTLEGSSAYPWWVELDRRAFPHVLYTAQGRFWAGEADASADIVGFEAETEEEDDHGE